MTNPFDAVSVMEAFREYDASALDLDNPKLLLLATVDPAYAGPPAVPKVTFDGETILTTKTYQYLGQAPKASSRVLMQPIGSTHIIMGPIGGNEHIIAGVQQLPTPKLTSYFASANGSQALTTTETDIAGATVTFTCGVGAILVALAKIDLRMTTVGIGYATVNLYLDGVNVNVAAFQAADPDWRPGMDMWRTSLTAGSHTVKLRQSKASSGGAATTEFHTNVCALVWE